MVYDPISQGAGAGYAGSIYPGSHFGGGGTALSAGERRQNELEDVRRQINAEGGLSPELLAIINGTSGYAESMDPDSLVKRYQAVADARDSLYGNQNNAAKFIQQVFGGTDQTNQYAYDTYRSVFGRDPTAEEFAKVLPVFGGAEGRQRGAAYISELFDQYKQSPEYLGKQAGQYGDELGGVFQEVFGRGARADETDYFGRMRAAGRTPFEIRQMLEASPEYQTAQDTKFRSGLASELEGYDTSFFDKQKQGIYADYARRGFGAGTSPSLDYALTSLMGDIAEKRGSYLAGISSQQYGGNKNAAREDYRANMSRYFDDQDYERNRKQAELGYYRGRSDEDRDYQRQKEDYFQMLARNKQGRDAFHTGDWINLGLQGANAYANSQSGRTTNNYYDYLNY